ncbi:MAG: hypothetical protein KAU31_01715 [Spirochaetaceae bacterium]|nr:hypothetical protein [Spirochaetaceae bacterium]
MRDRTHGLRSIRKVIREHPINGTVVADDTLPVALREGARPEEIRRQLCNLVPDLEE